MLIPVSTRPRKTKQSLVVFDCAVLSLLYLLSSEEKAVVLDMGDNEEKPCSFIKGEVLLRLKY